MNWVLTTRFKPWLVLIAACAMNLSAIACPPAKDRIALLKSTYADASVAGANAERLSETVITALTDCADTSAELDLLTYWTEEGRVGSALGAAKFAGLTRHGIARKSTNRRAQADAAYRLATIIAELDRQSAQRYAIESAESYEQMGMIAEAAQVHSFLSRILRRQGRFLQALAEENSALRLRRSARPPIAVWLSLIGMATLYKQLELFDESRRSYAEALADVERDGSPEDVSMVLTSYAGFLNDMGGEDAAAAKRFAEQALAIERGANRPIRLASALLQMGRSAFNLGELESADRALAEALQVAKLEVRSAMDAHVLMRWGELALAQGQPELALSRLNAAREIYIQQGNQFRLIKNYQLLQQTYLELRDPLQAATAGLEHYRLRDQLFGRIANAQLGEMLGRFERNEERLRFERVKQEKAVAELALNNERNRFQIFLIIALSFLGLSSLLAWRHFTVERLYRVLRERNNLVQSQTEQLSLANAQLTEQAQSLRMANRAKSQFLANMSHEIRTPMNAVIGIATLLERTPLNERQSGLLHQLGSSARMLMCLINDILDLSRIEAGKLRIEHSQFRLDDVLTDVASVVGERARAKGLDLLYSVQKGLPSLLNGDPVRLQQLLVNLTTNALKFTEHGQVLVEISAEHRGDDELMLKVVVRDSGIGISAENLARLFQPFSQVDDSDSRKQGGVGLGLAICKRLVELMGGQIGAESTPGQGSAFWFTAPFALVHDEQAPTGQTRSGLTAADSAVPEPPAGLRVLVVDDNLTTRKVFGSMLESLRFTVTLADSAEAALAQIQSADHAFDLLLMDWKLPGMNGIEALQEISRRGLKLPATLMVTAYGGETLVREAREAGVAVFLHKPVSPSTLYDATMQALGRSQHPAASEPESISPLLRAEGRVLLVEDNAINRLVATELLGELGVTVSEVENGLAALEILDREDFDLILMDIQMPGLDGVETTRRIRQRASGNDIVIVALTAHAMIGDRQRFLDAGMNDYLAKPIEANELQRVLTRWLALERPPSIAPSAQAGEVPILAGVDVRSALARVNGKQDLLWRLIEDFRHRHGDAALRLRSLVEASDWQAAHDLAHTVKGASTTLGLSQVAAAASQIDASVRVEQRNADALRDLDHALAELTALVLPEPAADAAVPPSAGAPGGPDLDAWNSLAEALSRNNLNANKHYQVLLDSADPKLRSSLAEVGRRLEAFDFAGAAESLTRLRQQIRA